MLYSDTLRDENNAPISGMTVYVYDASGQLATGLEDAIGDPLDNPLTTDAFGNFSFEATNGFYTLDLFIGGRRAWKQNIILGVIPLDGAKGLLASNRGALVAISGQSAGQAALLGESSREGMFVWSSTDFAAQFGASLATIDPNQGIYVAPASAPTGASGAWVRKSPIVISVKSFGAMGDAVVDGGGNVTSGTDDTAAIQAAYNFANTLGGAEVFYPRGFYKTTASIRIYPNTVSRGEGRKASMVRATHAGTGTLATGVRSGSAFYSLFAINSSTRADIHFHDLGIVNKNGANIGAAYYDQGGTFITGRSVYVEGFKYGAVLDQSELVDLDLCDFELQTATGLWLVNGADLVVGGLGGFTNRISVVGCQFNQSAAIPCIVDDGGAAHSYRDNNYNGGLNSIRVAGVTQLIIDGGEFESTTGHVIHLAATSFFSAVGVGACSGVISGGIYACPSGFGAINIASAGFLEISNNWFSTPTGASIRGVVNAARMEVGTNVTTYAADPLVDGYATIHSTPLTLRSAAPTTGYHYLGETVLNSAPAALGIVGWRCVVAGTPGTWETLRVSGDVSGTGAPLTVNSSSSSQLKVTFKNNGTVTGYVGSDAAYPFVVGDAAAAVAFTIDLNKNAAFFGQVDIPAAKILTVGTVQVVAARKTGWAVDTGTAKRTANATYTGTAEAAYTQATIQTLMDKVRDLSQTIKALKDDLHGTAGHGLIGT